MKILVGRLAGGSDKQRQRVAADLFVHADANAKMPLIQVCLHTAALSWA